MSEIGHLYHGLRVLTASAALCPHSAWILRSICALFIGKHVRLIIRFLPRPLINQQLSWIRALLASVALKCELRYTRLDAPIQELQLKIWKAKRLPEGREGCDDSKKMELLLVFDEQFRGQDQLLLSRYDFDWNIRNAIAESCSSVSSCDWKRSSNWNNPMTWLSTVTVSSQTGSSRLSNRRTESKSD